MIKLSSSSLALFVNTYAFLFLLNFKLTETVNCFVCTSYNHDNLDCEDPFLRSDKVKLEEDCATGVPNKIGSFRASHCIKLVAYGYGNTYFVRTCSIDMLSGKEDQEIVRVNHCGYIALKNFFGFDKLFNYSMFSNLTTKNNIEKPSSSAQSSFHNAAKFRGCLSVCSTNECNNSISIHLTKFNTKTQLLFCFLAILALFLLINFLI